MTATETTTQDQSYKVRTVTTLIEADGTEKTTTSEHEYKSLSEEEWAKRKAEILERDTCPIAVKIRQFMDALEEVAELGKEIAEEGVEGDSQWHKEYAKDEEDPDYHQSFLDEIETAGRVCSSMWQLISGYGRC